MRAQLVGLCSACKSAIARASGVRDDDIQEPVRRDELRGLTSEYLM